MSSSIFFLQFNELYERRVDVQCKKYDLVSKQIDTYYRQLNCKLCDLIYLLVALIFCLIRCGIPLATITRNL